MPCSLPIEQAKRYSSLERAHPTVAIDQDGDDPGSPTRGRHGAVSITSSAKQSDARSVVHDQQRHQRNQGPPSLRKTVIAGENKADDRFTAQ